MNNFFQSSIEKMYNLTRKGYAIPVYCTRIFTVLTRSLVVKNSFRFKRVFSYEIGWRYALQCRVQRDNNTLLVCCMFAAVCTFPYIIAFTTDTMEIRLIINGNLVQTMAMPKLKLICSKVCTDFWSSNRFSFFSLFDKLKFNLAYRVNITRVHHV